MTDLNDYDMFVRIVDAGGITAAARVLHQPKSTVSRRLSALEKALGTKLINRSTRAVSLTDDGQRLYDDVAPVVRRMHEVTTAAQGLKARPQGLVRVSATAAYARHFLLPELCSFMDKYADVRIDLVVEDRRAALTAEGVDIAIRFGLSDDSDLKVRHLSTVGLRLAAAPAYLDRHGRPATPSDLKNHEAVATSATQSEVRFEDETIVRMPWRMALGSMELVHAAVLDGRGIAMLPDYLIDRDLDAGRLETVLPDHPVRQVPVAALYPPGAVDRPAVRALVDWLARRL